jgi:heat shock protein 5
MDKKHWPFKLANKGGKPMLQVEHRGDIKDFVSLRKSDAWQKLTSRLPRRSLLWFWSR